MRCITVYYRSIIKIYLSPQHTIIIHIETNCFYILKNNVQRRIVLYYKVFKYVWPDICTRRNIPRCIKHKVRSLFPGDISSFNDIDSRFY